MKIYDLKEPHSCLSIIFNSRSFKKMEYILIIKKIKGIHLAYMYVRFIMFLSKFVFQTFLSDELVSET